MASIYQAFMDKAHNLCVRDLAWMLASPPLIAAEHSYFAGQAVTSEWCEQHFIKFLPQLYQLESHPEPLKAWIRDRSSQRLGRYFESLISYWLQHAPGLSQVSSSVKVKRAKLTIGEFDFVYVDELKTRPIHLEVAVKFYLRHGSGESWHHFVGPLAQDRLDIKLRHLFERQLQLSETVEGALALKPYGDVSLIQRLALVKGFCFDPVIGQKAATVYSSPGLADQRLRGWWISIDEIDAWVKQRPNSYWIILPKLEWLAPAIGLGAKTPESGPAVLANLEDAFGLKKQPLLLAELQASRQGFQEISRGFVVPTAWPEAPAQA